MNKYFIFALLLVPLGLIAQIDSIVMPASSTSDLPSLLRELALNNADINAGLREMDIRQARIPQAGALDDPEFRFMQEGMPGFRWDEAMYSRFMLMQKIPFPGKLGTRTDLARIRYDHAHHDHLEKIDDAIANLKMSYSELWLAQQNMILDRENARLMNQFADLARKRYGAGAATQPEALKAQVELAMIGNDLVTLRQRELSAKAMIMALLNRSANDTIGYAEIPETISFSYNLDSLIDLAMHQRPMVMHDSAMIDEGKTMLVLAKQEYLPDFELGIERMASPGDSFRGWSVVATVEIPFAPWTLDKASARVDEADAAIAKARDSYSSSRAMVAGNIRDLYYKADAAKQQLENFQKVILPQTRQSLTASLTAYENGSADYLMLLDAYRSNMDLTKEYSMVRMQFDQSVAGLEREVGAMNF